jgi:D-beta-D-heptose 7-phosphate kinase/D-beta-D-heptose 1-phosphate adenosyltransferase
MQHAAIPNIFSSRGRKIAVIGDVMLDCFLYGEVERISPEAPVPVVRRKETRSMLGGAGNVARNIVDLGGQAILIGLRGRDSAAEELLKLISLEERITDQMIESPNRETISKLRIIAGNQQIVRVDDEEVSAPTKVETTLLNNTLKSVLPGCDAIIISDYGKGVITQDIIQNTMSIAREKGCLVFVDPKVDDFSFYRGADILTPNARELARATGMATTTEAEVAAAGQKVITETGISALLCTRAEKGMTLVTAAGEVISSPSEAREVFDVSGAGDTVIATLALMCADGFSLTEAMRISNIAAGLVVAKLGTATVSRQELSQELTRRAQHGSERAGILGSDEAKKLVQGWRTQHLRVGFTNGCFDILHAGHIALLAAARRQCDRLVVGLNSDKSVSSLKGPSRPINTLEDRASIIAALGMVDAVVAFAESSPIKLIETLRPDVLIKGADYTIDNVVGADIVRASGGKVVLIDLLPGHSTTSIIQKISHP